MKNLMLIAALGLVAACGTGLPEDETKRANLGESKQEIMACCVGSWSCPSTGSIYIYKMGSCSLPTSEQAMTRCEQNCSLPCVDNDYVCP